MLSLTARALGTARVPGTARYAWLFARLMGAIQFVFFLSLAVQAMGLFGSRGILPAQEVWKSFVGSEGAGVTFVVMPGWQALFGVSDPVIYVFLVIGILSSLGLMLGFFEGVAALLSWSLVVTLCSLGTLFLRFQWDALLMECSFLTVLLVFSNPVRRGERRGSAREWIEIPRVLFWVFVLLAVRLWFGSGLVKLLSGDPVWRNGTALSFHFETQPLPTPFAPWVHRGLSALGAHFTQALTFGVLAVELLIPWVLVASSFRMRQGSRVARAVTIWAGAGLVALQFAIVATGNYAFFNLLTLGVTGWLFEGAQAVSGAFPGEAQRREWHSRFRATFVNAVAGILLVLGAAQLLEQSTSGRWRFLGVLRASLSGFGVLHSYGLFARMTLERDELVLQASQDGRDWRDYELPYKPGEPTRALRWVAPHQPRLDWHAWFAALETPRPDVLWRPLTLRLLAAEPSVLRLFEGVPFGAEPPRYVRTLRYRYRLAPQGGGGMVWVRELRGVYLPEMTIIPP